MLWNEARIYNAFPRELQEASPDGPPVVPKFYGFYTPSVAFDYPKVPAEDRTTVRKMIKSISPILLLEECGKQLMGRAALEFEDLREIDSLLSRLHKADFVQGSLYPRNMLVQPGPLRLPRAKRSIHVPSFRIIDFGRGMCPRVNCVLKHFLQEKLYERDKFRDRWIIREEFRLRFGF
ncbi:hypothetical protein BC827DRAFT_1245892 [Russula dissimulans]|nr:hypothetical protein BC827DRAFT_1245892 [Russula dissimulans]